MYNSSKEIALAMTGASGISYGLRLLECLLKAGITVHLMISRAAYTVVAMETDLRLPSRSKDLQRYLANYFSVALELIHCYSENQWTSPLASGSHCIPTMIVCPCTVGAISAIARGANDNLIERAADVMIKEQRKLILVPRETPFSAIHLENMLTLARLGTVVLPANPGFYHQPQHIGELIDYIVARILDHAEIPHQLLARWGEN
ncbi:flavin prenyltransferase UbiX [Candidatus Nitrosacidococcus sp. I8]|uniref:flavin prenyltransferase UbiX n=1 Tax=Candidatus Nitrosacidococcus sp. I8 TaxID=2942908 RepID=UPI0022271DB1|nr:flavin prenyltransferase UbiX [Candidatus Nitrosacidococcus sp. I8]CAH9017195.1 Flavin prenyltransferase UbiX [Candidatus Nitrosacidococcus sp. I8]